MPRLDPQLLADARAGRRQPTPAQRLLWWRLRDRALGCHFRRQHPVGPYLVDFACWPARLAVLIRGPHAALERRRESHLAEQGWRVLALTESDVLAHLEATIHRIARAVPVEGCGLSPPGSAAAPGGPAA
jgi:very-short-patch-repair endonuclease